MKDIAEAANYIDSNLFRPPYGKITSFQAKNLRAAMKGKKAKVIMWDVLSADFDDRITKEQSLQFVILRAFQVRSLFFMIVKKLLRSYSMHFQKFFIIFPKKDSNFCL